MSKLLYLEDRYRTEASVTVMGITDEGGILLGKVFFIRRSAGSQVTVGI